MPIYSSSDSEDDKITAMQRPFGRERSVHALLGGGKVADVLLWRDKKVSTAILIGIATIWLLFEVVEYNLVTLLCHIFITAMLVIFIWCTGAEIFKWNTPRIPEIILRESTSREAVSILHAKFNLLLSNLLYIACGNDPKLFILTIVCLWVASVIGNYISTLNLVLFGLLCLETLPYLYERYQTEVDSYAALLSKRTRKMYRKFDSRVLEKIPRGPVKDKKAM